MELVDGFSAHRLGGSARFIKYSFHCITAAATTAVALLGELLGLTPERVALHVVAVTFVGMRVDGVNRLAAPSGQAVDRVRRLILQLFAFLALNLLLDARDGRDVVLAIDSWRTQSSLDTTRLRAQHHHASLAHEVLLVVLWQHRGVQVGVAAQHGFITSNLGQGVVFHRAITVIALMCLRRREAVRSFRIDVRVFVMNAIASVPLMLHLEALHGRGSLVCRDRLVLLVRRVPVAALPVLRQHGQPVHGAGRLVAVARLHGYEPLLGGPRRLRHR